jgi:UDP-N-acetylmuramoyl-tripeptide--D-alanyl-D-alanine ligase
MTRAKKRLGRRAFAAGMAAAAAYALWETGSVAGDCAESMTAKALDRSLSLGTRFLLANQKKAGNFEYELDWKTGEYTDDDSPVRQAGATWGLALIHQDLHRRGEPRKKVAKALSRALDFFDQHSVSVGGRRFIRYPDTDAGRLGTVALVSLALVDLLRVAPNEELRKRLDEHIAFLLSARHAKGRFHASYRHRTGKPVGAPSPYFDGEALLALVKAAKYLGKSELSGLVRAEAEAGFAANVKAALEDDPDSSTTKGYYQWASMAYFELATWKKPGVHGERLMDLADWMIDVHRTLKRTRNTGYAYEGIIPAYAIAKATGATERAKKLRCTIDRGLSKLTSWQVGHPMANGYIRARNEHDARAIGGVQNHRKESRLRIDVTQHQMHAVILARRHVWT